MVPARFRAALPRWQVIGWCVGLARRFEALRKQQTQFGALAPSASAIDRIISFSVIRGTQQYWSS